MSTFLIVTAGVLVLRPLRVLLGLLIAVLALFAVLIYATVAQLLGGSLRVRNLGYKAWTRCAPLVYGLMFTRIERPRLQLDPGRPVILLGPHPRDVEVLAYGHTMARLTRGAIGITVQKLKNLKNMFGAAAAKMGSVFIDRKDKRQALAALQAPIKVWAKDDRLAFCVYLDGTREMSDRYRQELLGTQLRSWAKHPEICKAFRAILSDKKIPPPKHSGLATLVQAFREQDQNPQLVYLDVRAERRVGLGKLFFRSMGRIRVRAKLLPELEQLDWDDVPAVLHALLQLWIREVPGRG